MRVLTWTMSVGAAMWIAGGAAGAQCTSFDPQGRCAPARPMLNATFLTPEQTATFAAPESTDRTHREVGRRANARRLHTGEGLFGLSNQRRAATAAGQPTHRRPAIDCGMLRHAPTDPDPAASLATPPARITHAGRVIAEPGCTPGG